MLTTSAPFPGRTHTSTSSVDRSSKTAVVRAGTVEVPFANLAPLTTGSAPAAWTADRVRPFAASCAMVHDCGLVKISALSGRSEISGVTDGSANRSSIVPNHHMGRIGAFIARGNPGADAPEQGPGSTGLSGDAAST